MENRFKVTIEIPIGDVFIGRGDNIEAAYKDAIKNFRDANIPTKGPGIWEMPVDKKA